MLTNVNLFIETMQAGHRHTESVLALLSKLCTKTALPDVQSECEQLRMVLRDTDSMFATLRDASTADLSSILRDIKKYASDAVAAESQQLQASVQRSSQTVEANLSDRFKKLEARVLSELAAGGSEDPGASGTTGLRAKGGDAGLLKKVMNRVGDFEQQVASQLSLMSADLEKKIAFIQSQPRGGPNFISGGGNSGGLDSLGHDVLAMKYDVGELKDLMNAAKGDAAHMKRIVLACERDMEDFTAAMDAVNVDLDEMRARVDATHSIITSRQRVEATVTAEISTMRLDMGDMQEALKAHDAWMEDVSQSLQEAHERCHQLAEDLAALRDQTQQKLDAKTDISAWNDMNDDIDASIKTVRDMASALRLEVDSRRRKVDETLNQMRGEMRQLEGKVDTNHDGHQRFMDEAHAQLSGRLDEHAEAARGLQDVTDRHQEIHREIQSLIEEKHAAVEAKHSQMEADLRKQDEDFHKEINDRVDAVERHQASVGKESSKRLNALDLRISGLQGATGELKRDTNKLRDEVNSLTVKSAAHDVDIGKNCDDLRRMERQRAEDNQRHKQDMDGVYEELDQKVYEKSFQTLEDHVTKLTRGTVKLCQVVGVFPGARMNDGTEEELDVDVELLNWEDCAQNLTGRVEKVWRQLSSQKYRSILDLVSKKADHSVLRLLQISQQHIESQLDRVRHERELWKEVVDKRSQQPLQLALTLKDPHTGLPLAGPPPPGFQAAGMPGMAMGFNPMAMGGPGNPVTPPSFLAARPVPAAMQNPMLAQAQDPLAQTAPLGTGALVDPRMSVDPTMKAAGAPAQAPTPLAKRIAKPPGPPPPPQR